MVFGLNVDEVEGVCENEASFVSTSSQTKTFIEFSMELLKDSMKLANLVIVSDKGGTTQFLRVTIPGAYEDKRPAGSFDRPTTGLL